MFFFCLYVLYWYGCWLTGWLDPAECYSCGKPFSFRCNRVVMLHPFEQSNKKLNDHIEQQQRENASKVWFCIISFFLDVSASARASERAIPHVDLLFYYLYVVKNHVCFLLMRSRSPSNNFVFRHMNVRLDYTKKKTKMFATLLLRAWQTSSSPYFEKSEQNEYCSLEFIVLKSSPIHPSVGIFKLAMQHTWIVSFY